MSDHNYTCAICRMVVSENWRHDCPGTDSVNHPSHYTTHASGVECIDIVEHMSFNLGNAIKYIWRAGLKSPNAEQDLRKAAWYVNREIKRLGHGQVNKPEEHRGSDTPTAPGIGQAQGSFTTRDVKSG